MFGEHTLAIAKCITKFGMLINSVKILKSLETTIMIVVKLSCVCTAWIDTQIPADTRYLTIWQCKHLI